MVVSPRANDHGFEVCKNEKLSELPRHTALSVTVEMRQKNAFQVGTATVSGLQDDQRFKVFFSFHVIFLHFLYGTCTCLLSQCELFLEWHLKLSPSRYCSWDSRALCTCVHVCVCVRCEGSERANEAVVSWEEDGCRKAGKQHRWKKVFNAERGHRRQLLLPADFWNRNMAQ